MTKDKALASIEDACSDGLKHLYAMLEQGLVDGQPAAEALGRFRKGLATHCDAHAKATAAVEDYFRGFK